MFGEGDDFRERRFGGSVRCREEESAAGGKLQVIIWGSRYKFLMNIAQGEPETGEVRTRETLAKTDARKSYVAFGLYFLLSPFKKTSSNKSSAGISNSDSCGEEGCFSGGAC